MLVAGVEGPERDVGGKAVLFWRRNLGRYGAVRQQLPSAIWAIETGVRKGKESGVFIHSGQCWFAKAEGVSQNRLLYYVRR
jgi:hypothetical protein